MTLRLAIPDDVPASCQLLERVVPLMQQAGNFQGDETYPNAAVFHDDIVRRQLWIMELEGQLVGVSAITTDQEPTYADVGWDVTEPAIVTHRLAVDPAFRGKGIAKALLK